MALPDQIPLRYTEDDAGYMSVRPVVKQTFRLHELIDMVVSVAGKDPARVQQIVRSGTVVYHGYRYWWEALSAEISQREASQKRLFARQSPWDVILGFASSHPARYEKFDHGRKADLFRVSLAFEQARALLEGMLEAAPRKLRYRWSTLRPPAVMNVIAPRK